MQKTLVSFLCFLLFNATACNNVSKKAALPLRAADNKQQSFFPVTHFILGQLNEIDSMPVTPLKLITINSKTDSIWMTRKDIRIFAEPFLHPFIDSANLQNWFAEKSFMDQTINAITLSYDPVKTLPDSMQLTHWDVYINPQKNAVDRIYITKQKDGNGMIISRQLTWKANKWCSIRTITQQNTAAPKVSEEKLVWNFDEE